MGWSGSLTTNSVVGNSITYTPDGVSGFWNYSRTSFTAPKKGVYRFVLRGSSGENWNAPNNNNSKIRDSGGSGGQTTYYRFMEANETVYAGCGGFCSCAYIATSNATSTTHALSTIPSGKVYAVAGAGGNGGLIEDTNNETQYNCVRGQGGGGGGSTGGTGGDARNQKGGGGGTQTSGSTPGQAGTYGAGHSPYGAGTGGYFAEGGHGGDGWYGGAGADGAARKWDGADAPGGGGGSSYCHNGLNGTISYAGSTYTNGTIAGSRGGAGNGSYGSITITYMQEANGLPTPPTSLWMNKNMADSLGETCYLSWSGASAGFMNKITHYNIYKNGSLLAQVPVDDATSYSNYPVIAPVSPDTTDTYTITTTVVFTQETSSTKTSSPSNGVALKTTSRTNPSVPTNVSINNATTCYIGDTGLSSLTISWNASNAGIYNSIAKYAIYKDGTSIGETTSTSYSLLSLVDKTGNYTVRAIGSTSGQSDASSIVSIVQIAKPAKPTMILSVPEVTARDISLKWEPVMASTGSSVSYLLQYKQNDKDLVTEGELNNTSYTFNITKIDKGKSFILYTYAKANASGGSYTLSDAAIINTGRVGIFDIPTSPETFWKGIYDPASLLTGRQGHAYGSIDLYWAPATQTEASGTIYTYILKCKVGSSAWNDIYTITKAPTDSDYGQNLHYNYSLANITSNTAVSFYVLVRDNYNTEISCPETQVIKLALPSVTNFQTIISYKEAGASFTTKPTTNGLNDNLCYALYFSYKEKESLYAEKEIVESSGIVQPTTYEIKVEDGKNANINTFLGALYDIVITQRLPYPEGVIRAKVYYKSYPQCYVNVSNNVVYNFLHEITTPPKITFTMPSAHSTYCNSSDLVPYRFSSIGWTDAAGGTSGATITYSMSSNYQINFSDNLLPNTDYITTLPIFQVDDTVIYTLTTKITYNDGNSRANTTSISFNAARWYDGDSLLINSPKQIGGVVTGNYSLPSTLWSSAKYANLTKVVLTIYGQDKTTTYPTTKTTITDFNNLNLLVPFTFSGVDEAADIVVCAQAVCTNTSGATFTIFSSFYIVRSAAVTMALRKGALGLNVSGDFNPADTESTLYVNAKPKGEAPTVVIAEDADQPNGGRVIQLKKGLVDYGGFDIKNDFLLGRGMTKTYSGSMLVGKDLNNHTLTIRPGNQNFKNNCPIIVNLDYNAMDDEQKRAAKHLRIININHNLTDNSVTITYRSNKCLIAASSLPTLGANTILPFSLSGEAGIYIPFILQIIGVIE